MFEVPPTVAVNCCVSFFLRFTAPGLTETVTGSIVIVALADSAGSSTLVAVTVKICVEATEAGAV